MSGQDPIQPRPPRRALTALALAALGIGCPQAATDPPSSALSWALLIGGSLLGGAAATEVLDLALRQLRQPPEPRPTDPSDGLESTETDERQPAEPARPKRKLPSLSFRVILLPALAGGLALAIGLSWPTVIRTVRFHLYGCAPATAIRVLTTPESLAATSELATAYEQSTAESNRGCPEAEVYVYAADPIAVREALLAGWSGESLRELGPRPEVWMPDSTVETGRLAARAKETGLRLPTRAVHSIATTPLVLALPATVAQAGEADGRWLRHDWSTLLATADRTGLSVVRPDPTNSATGEIATAVVYRSLAGGRAPTSAADTSAEWRLEHRLGHALDQGAYPLGNALGTLCRRRTLTTGPAADGAVLVTEEQLVRYNQGLPLGDSCPASATVPPEQRLVAAYPTDTVGLDHPFAQLHWSDQDAGQERGAAAFGDWLDSDAGARALLATGLRPTSGKAGSLPVTEPLVKQWGASPDAVFARSSPPVAQVESVLDRYSAATRPGRTLLLLDSSRSMAGPVAGGGKSRFDAARKAALVAVAQVAGRDEFGLWTFPAAGGPTRPLVPVAARSSQADAYAVNLRLAAVRPAGDTPLYRAIAKATDALRPANSNQVTLLLVLTDGQDTAGGQTPAQLAAVARRAGVRISVVAFGEANCADLALNTLTVDTGGQCVDAQARSLDAALGGLLDSAGGGHSDGN